MEYWNSGIMGSSLRPGEDNQGWIVGPAAKRMDNRSNMACILLRTNIPAFHHSIIPYSGQIRKPEKINIIDIL
jgi:hypothetical protein